MLSTLGTVHRGCDTGNRRLERRQAPIATLGTIREQTVPSVPNHVTVNLRQGLWSKGSALSPTRATPRRTAQRWPTMKRRENVHGFDNRNDVKVALPEQDAVQSTIADRIVQIFRFKYHGVHFCVDCAACHSSPHEDGVICVFCKLSHLIDSNW